jgi:hypothetical protein
MSLNLESVRPRHPDAPKGPPNQWIIEGNPHPFDVITGDWRKDREIARSRGLYPQPWWRRLWRALR